MDVTEVCRHQKEMKGDQSQNKADISFKVVPRRKFYSCIAPTNFESQRLRFFSLLLLGAGNYLEMDFIATVRLKTESNS